MAAMCCSTSAIWTLRKNGLIDTEKSRCWWRACCPRFAPSSLCRQASAACPRALPIVFPAWLAAVEFRVGTGWPPVGRALGSDRSLPAAAVLSRGNRAAWHHLLVLAQSASLASLNPPRRSCGAGDCHVSPGKSLGARGENRTRTLLPGSDFESDASTSSATRAMSGALYLLAGCQPTSSGRLDSWAALRSAGRHRIA